MREQWASVQDNISFDLPTFHKRLDLGDDWQRVVQGHLFLDHVITRMLQEALLHPEKIKLDRTNFSAKVDLCAALGLLAPGREALLRKVNRLRNSLAHDLHFRIEERHAVELKSIASDPFKSLVEHQLESYPYLTLMCCCIKALVVLLDMDREFWKEHRVKKRQREDDMRAAVANARRVLGYSPQDDHERRPIAADEGDAS